MLQEQQSLESSINDIKKQILKMANRAEDAIRLAANAYNTGETVIMDQIIADDSLINANEIEIDASIAALSERPLPPKELRFVIAAIKIV